MFFISIMLCTFLDHTSIYMIFERMEKNWDDDDFFVVVVLVLRQ